MEQDGHDMIPNYAIVCWSFDVSALQRSTMFYKKRKMFEIIHSYHKLVFFQTYDN